MSDTVDDDDAGRSVVSVVKPSGIKPPASRIGRPCQHSAPKAGPPPQTPDTKNGGSQDQRMRRPSDDYSKSNLADVDEETETDLVMEKQYRSSKSKSPDTWRSKSTDRKVSNGSMSSDLYWEATGRRRSSDQGVVLTQDTDSFIIGQRVWVGGIRPGHIAYIGETHFAPGDWAGIVLDEPNGKNDGCVSGKRYFQCEPKKGIFSRLTRMTREPLHSADDNSFNRSMTTSPARSGTVSPVPSSIRYTPSTRKSSSKGNMCVGDRVIVSSGFGSRPGILKFLGEAGFAPGTWCGIMLDDPTGKNDGSVDGVRYFECPDKYGIFVPVAKVTLSPSSKKTPSRLSRAGSKESLTSIGTLGSMASTATSRMRISSAQKLTSTAKQLTTPKNSFSLQEVLREKQNHIEQLLMEKDLDRQDTENQATIYKKDISELKTKVQALEKVLNEEAAKNERLQSSLEEVQFCNEELQIQAQEFKDKIGPDVVAVDGALMDSVTLKQDEIRHLKDELGKKISENNELEKKNFAIQAEITEMHKKLSELQENLALNVSGTSVHEQSFKDEISYLKQEVETLKLELFEKDESIEKQFLGLKDIENALQLKISELEKQVESQKSSSDKYSDQNAQLMNQIEEYTTILMSKEQEILRLNEYQLGVLNERDIMINDIKSTLKRVQDDHKKALHALELKSAELLSHQEEISKLKSFETNYLQQLEENASKLKLYSQDLDILKDSTETNKTLKKENDEHRSKVGQLENQIQELLNENNLLKANHNANFEQSSTIILALQNEIAVLKSNLTALDESKKSLNDTLTDREKLIAVNSNDMQAMSTELDRRDMEIRELRDCVGKLKNAYQDLKASSSEKSKEIAQLKTLLLEVTAQLETAKLEQKQALVEIQTEAGNREKEVHALKTANKEKAEEITKLKSIFSDLEAAEDIKSAEALKLAQLNHNLTTSLNEKSKIIEDHFREIETLQSDLKSSKAMAENSLKRINEFDLENQHLRTELDCLEEKCNQFRDQKTSLQQEIEVICQSSNDDQLVKLTDELQVKQKELDLLTNSASEQKLSFEKTKAENTQQISNYCAQIDKLKLEMDQLALHKIDRENELNVEIAKIKLGGEEIKTHYEESIAELKQKFKTEKDGVISDINKKLDESENRKNELNMALEKLEKMVQTLQNDLDSEKNVSNIKEKEFENIKESLEKSVSEVLADNQKLRSEAEAFEIKVADLNSSGQDLQSRLSESSEELTKVRMEAKLLKEEISKINTGLSKAVELSNGKEIEASKIVQALNLELSDVKKSFEELKQAQAKSQKESEEISAQNKQEKTRLQKQLDELSAKLGHQEKMSQTSLEEIKNSASQTEAILRAEYEEKFKGLQLEKESLKQEYDTKIAHLSTVHNLSDDLKNELLAKSEELKLKNDNLQELSTNLNGLSKILTEKDYQISQLVSNSESIESSLKCELMAREKSYQELVQKLENLERKKSNMNSESENTIKEKALAELTKERKLWETKSVELIANIAKLERALEESSVTQAKDLKLASSVEQLRKEVENLKMKNKFLEEQLVNSKTLEDILPPENAAENSTAQISFLNSIIADMQKKNETLVSRVQALESTPKDFSFLNEKKRKPAPRIFCDICDVFDAHETEDCPLQASEEPEPALAPPRNIDGTKVIPPPRKYCENCECFGHEKGECDQDECF